MLSDDQKSRLIKLAAEMVRGEGMPSDFVEDWDLPKTTPMKTRRKIQKSSATALAQCHEWANRIMDVVREPIPSMPQESASTTKTSEVDLGD